MRGFAIHLGRHSALPEQRPHSFFEAFAHAEGVALWAGPVGLIVYTR